MKPGTRQSTMNNRQHRFAFIDDHMDRLRKSERKVAEYIPLNADKIIHYSLNEFAEQVGVSEPTVIRFCRALGFSGWQAFKIYLAQAIIPQVQNIHESITENEDSAELAKKVCTANITAIQETLGILNYSGIEQAIQALSHAQRVVFQGAGGSAIVAMDAYHKFFRTGLKCDWFDDSHMALMSASLLTAGDVFVAISHTGSSRDIVETTQVAKKAGATTIAIVSHAKSPISKVADITIKVEASEVKYRFEPMSSRIVQLCIIDVLAVGVGLLRKDELYSNLRKSRKAVSTQRF